MLASCRGRTLVGVALIMACSAIGGLSAQGAFVPARYRDGELARIPLLAVGGGEVLLELTISSTGVVAAVRTLRATPPFTDLMIQTAGRWRFSPAEEETATEPPIAPGLKPRRAIESKVLVAGVFRPPSINTPTLGVLPADVAPPSVEVPAPVLTVLPLYPPLARDSGTVLVEVGVDIRGNVSDARAVRSSPPFDEPALDAARQWKFQPALVNGTFVDAVAYIVFGFRQPVTGPSVKPPVRQ